MYEEDSLLKSIRQIVREELSRMEFVSATEKTEQPQAGDVDDDVLDFLRSLQGDEID